MCNAAQRVWEAPGEWRQRCGAGQGGGHPLGPPQLLQKAAGLGPAAQRSGAAAGRARLSRAAGCWQLSDGFSVSSGSEEIYLYFKEWGKKIQRGPGEHGSTAL